MLKSIRILCWCFTSLLCASTSLLGTSPMVRRFMSIWNPHPMAIILDASFHIGWGQDILDTASSPPSSFLWSPEAFQPWLASNFRYINCISVCPSIKSWFVYIMYIVCIIKMYIYIYICTHCISVRSISGQTRKLVTRHVESTNFVYSLALATLLQQRRRLQGLAASMPVPHAGGATGWVWLRVEHMVHGFYHIFGVSGNKKQQILAWILWDLASLWQWIKQLLHLNKNCLGWFTPGQTLGASIIVASRDV